MGIVGTHPAVFVRVASKELTGYGTWKSSQEIENKGFANMLFARKCLMRSETRAEGVPHPGCFCKRVRNRLKINELSLCGTQKNSEECETKEVRFKAWEIRGFCRRWGLITTTNVTI